MVPAVATDPCRSDKTERLDCLDVVWRSSSERCRDGGDGNEGPGGEGGAEGVQMTL